MAFKAVTISVMDSDKPPRIIEATSAGLVQAKVAKIVFMGAESTGKSTIARALAEKYRTAYVAEYGREYFLKNGCKMEPHDFVIVARQHRENEDNAMAGCDRFMFVDTNALTTKYFSQHYNNCCLPELAQMADECAKRYAHFFICDTDIPYVADNQRNPESIRTRMQAEIMADLDSRQIKYTILSGTLAEREAKAGAVLDALKISAANEIA